MSLQISRLALFLTLMVPLVSGCGAHSGNAQTAVGSAAPVPENVPLPQATPDRTARAAAYEPAPGATVTLIGVGDIMIGTDFPQDFLNPAIRPGTRADDLLEPGLLALLRRADVAFGNLEGTLFDGTGPHKTCGNPANCYVFRSPEFYAEILADAGFTMMSLANNHSGDFLAGGRAATRAALERAGIAYAGLDEPGARTGTVTLDDGTRVGLVAFAPNAGTLQLNDHGRAESLVRGLAADHDIVVVSFHGGAEGGTATRVPRQTEIFLGENRGDVFAFSRRMIDAGADVVLGHGPHVPRAVEVYQGRFIAYSLGNFWTYARMNIRGLGGVGPVVELELAPDGRLVAGRIHGTRQHDGGVPRLDPGNEAAAVIAELTARDFPEVPLTIGRDGALSGPGLSGGSIAER